MSEEELTPGEKILKLKIELDEKKIYDKQITYVIEGTEISDEDKKTIEETIKNLVGKMKDKKSEVLTLVESGSTLYEILNTKLPETFLIEREIKNLIINDGIVTVISLEKINGQNIPVEFKFVKTGEEWKIREIKFVEKWIEVLNILDTKDSDNDGLNDKMEEKYKTDILKPDTDGDGFTDGEEVLKGSDPLNKEDFPGKEIDIDKEKEIVKIEALLEQLRTFIGVDNTTAKDFVVKYYVKEKESIADKLQVKKDFIINIKGETDIKIIDKTKLVIEKIDGILYATFDVNFTVKLNGEERIKETLKARLRKEGEEWKFIFVDKLEIEEFIEEGLNKIIINVKGTGIKTIKVFAKGVEIKNFTSKDEKIVIDRLPLGEELKISVYFNGDMVEKVITLTSDVEMTPIFFGMLNIKDEDVIENTEFSWEILQNVKEYILAVSKDRIQNVDEADLIRVKLDGKTGFWAFKKEGIDGIVNDLAPNTKYFVMVKAVMNDGMQVMTKPVVFMLKNKGVDKYWKVKGYVISKNVNVKGSQIVFINETGEVFKTKVIDSLKFWDEVKKIYLLPYEITLKEGKYKIKAFIDSNNNGIADEEEAQTSSEIEKEVVMDQSFDVEIVKNSPATIVGINGPDILKVGMSAVYSADVEVMDWQVSDPAILMIERIPEKPGAVNAKGLKVEAVKLIAITKNGKELVKEVRVEDGTVPPAGMINGPDIIKVGMVAVYSYSEPLEYNLSDITVAVIEGPAPTVANGVSVKGIKAGTTELIGKTTSGVIIKKLIKVEEEIIVI